MTYRVFVISYVHRSACLPLREAVIVHHTLVLSHHASRRSLPSPYFRVGSTGQPLHGSLCRFESRLLFAVWSFQPRQLWRTATLFDLASFWVLRFSRSSPNTQHQMYSPYHHLRMQAADGNSLVGASNSICDETLRQLHLNNYFTRPQHTEIVPFVLNLLHIWAR